MNTKIIIIGLCMVIMAAEISGLKCSKCGTDGGVDACGCSEKSFKSVKVERPVISSSSKVVCKKIKGVDHLKPIGDVCDCGSIHVKPVVVPKPPCYTPPKPTCQQSQESSEESCDTTYVKASKSMHDFDFDYSEESDTNEEIKVPVDAVSMNLVQQLYRSATFHDSENRLFYGFESIPVEKPVRKIKEEVPEENLFTFDRKIVELKPQTTVIKCGDDEDSEVEIKESVKPLAFLSYSDLGYAPLKSVPSKFVKKCKIHSGSDEVASCESGSSGSSESSESVSCSCECSK